MKGIRAWARAARADAHQRREAARAAVSSALRFAGVIRGAAASAAFDTPGVRRYCASAGRAEIAAHQMRKQAHHHVAGDALTRAIIGDPDRAGAAVASRVVEVVPSREPDVARHLLHETDVGRAALRGPECGVVGLCGKFARPRATNGGDLFHGRVVVVVVHRGAEADLKQADRRIVGGRSVDRTGRVRVHHDRIRVVRTFRHDRGGEHGLAFAQPIRLARRKLDAAHGNRASERVEGGTRRKVFRDVAVRVVG